MVSIYKSPCKTIARIRALPKLEKLKSDPAIVFPAETIGL